MTDAFLSRELPPALAQLRELALDLRWTWTHGADSLWQTLDPAAWSRSANPWALLQDLSRDRLERAAADPELVRELGRLDEARQRYLAEPAWFGKTYPDGPLRRVAYFCMEFGLGEALPIYAGGLGLLAGDFLKASSDLGVPVVGVGLLYQEGYFRQLIDQEGRQREVFPYNDPTSLPIQPVQSDRGGWLHVEIELPGRVLYLRVWQARVGRVLLYLLDSNDPLNSPVDRGITGKLYGGGKDLRLMQEFVLGVGGWRALEALGAGVEICHLNEGHAAFAVLERARSYMVRHEVGFWEALWTTRAGNVFTTHTPVAAGFDRFEVELLERYQPYLREYVATLGISMADALALGRADPHDAHEPFNMAYLAIRGSIAVNGVSRLHGDVSRRILHELFPRWPEREVPVVHVTNGVHVPTWSSPHADALWEKCCGGDRWLGTDEEVTNIRQLTDEELWEMRAEGRKDLVDAVRQRLARQIGFRGGDPDAVAGARRAFDPNVLTLGFARRITEYKRPTLLLSDPGRLARLLTDPDRPAQLVVAGKAHPADAQGKDMVREWVRFQRIHDVRDRVVFLEDYDISLAQELVRGVDVWINNPRRPWEASGTSGMKVLVNGGLNLSERDGWWAEAYEPGVGWAFGDGDEHGTPEWDAAEAVMLYEVLEREVVPEFYTRDPRGIPVAWIGRLRASMGRLAPRFSANRMVREYVETLYAPAVERLRRRLEDGGRLGRELRTWQLRLDQDWRTLHFGSVVVQEEPGELWFTAQVLFGEVAPDAVRVELYADEVEGRPSACIVMSRIGSIPGAINGALFQARVPADRPAADYTPRIVPHHPEARTPLELRLIRWQH